MVKFFPLLLNQIRFNLVFILFINLLTNSNSLVRYLNITSEIRAKLIHKRIPCIDISSAIANRFFRNRMESVKPVVQNIQIVHLYLSIGLLIFIKTISPIMAKRIVDAEDISLVLAPNIVPNSIMAATIMVPTNPPGTAL